MRGLRLISACAAVLIMGAAAAQKRAPQPAPAAPYKAVTVTLPKPMADRPPSTPCASSSPTAAQRRDRAAHGAPGGRARLLLAPRECRNAADRRKSGVDNLAAAHRPRTIPTAAGWDILAGVWPTTPPPRPRRLARRRGAARRPSPAYDRKALDAICSTATDTDPAAVGLPGVGRHRRCARCRRRRRGRSSTGSACYLVRIVPDVRHCFDPASYIAHRHAGRQDRLRLRSTPIAPIGNDQICYVRDARRLENRRLYRRRRAAVTFRCA